MFRNDYFSHEIICHTFFFQFITFALVFCSDDIRKQMRKLYLSDANYTFEKVNRASLACGPLVKWAIAQVRATSLVSGLLLHMMMHGAFQS